MAKRILPVPGIYKITCVPTGKIYVGSSVKVSHRWNTHRRELSRGCHSNAKLQRSWAKYGAECFDFSVLELVADRADLIEAEQKWIDLLQPELNILMCAGSCLGRKLSASHIAALRRARETYVASAETRAKISKTLTGQKITAEALATRKSSTSVKEHLRALHENNKCRVVSTETRKRISEANKGKAVSAAARELIAASKRGIPRNEDTKAAISRASTRLRGAAMLAGRLPNVYWAGQDRKRPRWRVEVPGSKPVCFDNLLDAAAARYNIWRDQLANTLACVV